MLFVKVYYDIKASRQVFIGIVKMIFDIDSKISCHSLMSRISIGFGAGVLGN